MRVRTISDMLRCSLGFIVDFCLADLTVIITHPKYQRQGAGSLLLKQGLTRADEAGLDTYCYASVQGRPLYERHGFEVVQVDSMDLSEYGVDHVEIRAVMRRPAQNPHK